MAGLNLIKRIKQWLGLDPEYNYERGYACGKELCEQGRGYAVRNGIETSDAFGFYDDFDRGAQAALNEHTERVRVQLASFVK
jgi:hypothetical protein